MNKFIAVLSMMLLISVHSWPIEPAVLDAVKQKVVELHIALKEPPVTATKKEKRSHAKNLPNGATCTGALVTSMGDILTARHCTDAAAAIEVLFSDGRVYKATIVAQSARHDLALIHADRINTPYFTLASTLVQGQHIFVLGNPMGVYASLADGIVAKRDGDVDFIDVTVLPGNSGGPAFNDKGELVGITTAGIIVLYGFGHLNIMQSIDALVGFILELQQGARQ